MNSVTPLSDAAAVNAALQEYVPVLRRYFARRARVDDVDDLVQEVFLRMQAPLDLAAIEHIEKYLFRVAGSVLSDRGRRAAVRHEQKHESLEDLDYPIEERSPERVISDQQALARVLAAIERLPARTRDIFVLHRFEEMTCRNIAEQLGLSIS